MRRIGARTLRMPAALLRKLVFTRWLFQIRWFRVGVILFCLAFWIGAGFGCQALLRSMQG